MKITKYPQSCLLLEKNGQRIVIDPGKFFAEKYSFAELGEISAVLYTHRHGDHLDATKAKWHSFIWQCRCLRTIRRRCYTGYKWAGV
jgi:L-ascorbate metabolism protein UlaG (beta-lactamase superfamily)